MEPRQKLRYCLVGNASVLGIVVILVCICASDTIYFRFGPHDGLALISVEINTWTRWCFLLGVILLVEVSRVIVEELGMPVLSFNIYNPDKKVISDFSKNELQVYANAMYAISSMRGVVVTLVTVTQIDIAIWSVVVAQLASVYTIRLLLNEKRFHASESVSKNDQEGERVELRSYDISDAI